MIVASLDNILSKKRITKAQISLRECVVRKHPKTGFSHRGQNKIKMVHCICWGVTGVCRRSEKDFNPERGPS